MDIPVIVWYLIGALVLTKVPYVGVYVRLVATLIHEVGHVLMSAVTGGSHYKIRLFHNMEGEAESRRGVGFRSGVGAFLTALAGYPFTAFVGFGFVYLLYMGLYEWVLVVVLALLMVSLVLWVRNWFGFFWVIGFGSMIVSIFVLGEASEVVVEVMAYFISAVVLVESVTDALVILKLSVKDKEQSGDCYSLYKRTFIHPLVWGVGFTVVSLVTFVLGMNYWV